MRGCRKKVLIVGFISRNLKDIKCHLLRNKRGKSRRLGRVTYHHHHIFLYSLLNPKLVKREGNPYSKFYLICKTVHKNSSCSNAILKSNGRATWTELYYESAGKLDMHTKEPRKTTYCNRKLKKQSQNWNLI